MPPFLAGVVGGIIISIIGLEIGSSLVGGINTSIGFAAGGVTIGIIGATIGSIIGANTGTIVSPPPVVAIGTIGVISDTVVVTGVVTGVMGVVVGIGTKTLFVFIFSTNLVGCGVLLDLL